MMGLDLLGYLFLYFCLMVLILYLCCRFLKFRWIGTIILIIIFILVPFGREILTKGILLNYKSRNSPLQQINRTVEKPESVFWYDAVWPGFDDFGQRMMIKYYLDGIHLKKLAINDGQGNVNVYQAVADDYATSKKLYSVWLEAEKEWEKLVENIKQLGVTNYIEAEQLRKDKNSEYYKLSILRDQQSKENLQLYNLFHEQLKDDILPIIEKVKSYRLSDFLNLHVNEFNYKVSIHRQRLPEWQEEYVWADKITIYDVQKKEVIGYSKRTLTIGSPKLFYFLDVYSLTELFEKYHQGIGNFEAYEFDDRVLFEYARMKGIDFERNNLNNNKNI